MRVVFYLQRKKKYLLPLFQNSHFEMSRSWFQSSGESSWVYIQDLQACSSLQEIDLGTSRFRSEHDFSNMISLIFFFILIWFLLSYVFVAIDLEKSMIVYMHPTRFKNKKWRNPYVPIN